jgi:hypothetical protein
MKTGRKGDYGYISHEKFRRLWITLALFALPVAVFLIGYIVQGTRMTIITVISAVGCLPACRSAVGLIMIMLRSSIPEEEYREIDAHRGTLTMSYEMYMTTYDKSAMVEAAAVCGKTVVALITDKKADVKYMEAHIIRILRANGYSSSVNILTDRKHFIERMDSMNRNAEALRSNITFKPDDKYPDLGIEDLIKHTMLAISL